MNNENSFLKHTTSYLKAYDDIELLKQDVMRPVRMELEVLNANFLKVELKGLR